MDIIHKTRQKNICKTLALAGILGPIIFWLISIVVASFQTNYDPMQQTLSALSLTPHGWIQNLAFYLLGILTILFAIGLHSGLQKRAGFNVAIVFIVLMALCVVMIGIFTTDTGPVVTLHAYIHHYTVQILGLLFPLACLLLIPSLIADPNWRGFTAYNILAAIVGIILIIGWIIGGVTGWMEDWIGLYERIFVANTVLWVEVMAFRLFLLPSQTTRKESQREGVFERILNGALWKSLGESGLFFIARMKNRNQKSKQRPAAFEISKYVAFGVLTAALISSHYRKRTDLNDLKKNKNATSNAGLLINTEEPGEHSGLKPVTKMVLSVMDEKD